MKGAIRTKEAGLGCPPVSRDSKKLSPEVLVFLLFVLDDKSLVDVV